MSKNPLIARYNPNDGLDADDDTQIRCPYCGTDHNPPDSENPDLVTYFGDRDRVEFECSDCRQKFYVQENVTRSYTAFKAEA